MAERVVNAVESINDRSQHRRLELPKNSGLGHDMVHEAEHPPEAMIVAPRTTANPAGSGKRFVGRRAPREVAATLPAAGIGRHAPAFRR